MEEGNKDQALETEVPDRSGIEPSDPGHSQNDVTVKKGRSRKGKGSPETGMKKSSKRTNRSKREYDEVLKMNQDIISAIEEIEEGKYGKLDEYSTDEKLLIFQSDLLDQIRQANEYRDSLQRVAADFDNYRKRVEKERDNFVKFANERLILNFLEVLDNLDRAMENNHGTDDEDPFRQGIKLIHSHFRKIMQDEGLRAIEETGIEFDPYKHDAMMQIVNDEIEENTVTDIFQKGYILNEKVIRPAKVRISKLSGGSGVTISEGEGE